MPSPTGPTGPIGTGGAVPDLGDDRTREVALNGSTVYVDLGCPSQAAASCRFTVDLTTKSPVATSSKQRRSRTTRKRVKLTAGRRTLKPGTAVTLRLRLTKAGRQVMRTRSKIAATQTLTRAITGATQRIRRTVTVRKLPTTASVRNGKTRLRIPFGSVTDRARRATVTLVNGRTVVAKATTTPVPGGSKSVTLSLTKAGRTQLARTRRVTIRITTTYTTGTTHTLTSKLRAGPPKRR